MIFHRSLQRYLSDQFAVVATLAAAAVLIAQPASAQSTSISTWQLTPQHINDSRLHAVRGSLNGTVIGLPACDAAAPFALQFDGNSKFKHRVQITDNIATANLPAQLLTVEAWVKVDQPLKWGGLCGVMQDNGSHERGWLLGFRESSFCFAVSSQEKKKLTYLTDSRSFEHGFWYHVVGTYDGQTMSLYVDGKLRNTSKEQSGPIAYPDTAEYTIGAYLDDDECYSLTGQIEQVSVFNKALSSAEITGHTSVAILRSPRGRHRLSTTSGIASIT